ncbi:MAG: isoleucine--tRNA ligase [Patescibacteria group bacterium]|jgi:isoleucyl-tRNA synthetase
MFKSVDPKVSFPSLEEEILKYWDTEKIFEKVQAKNKDGKPYVFFEGPPTANAKPGIHHVESRVFKDLFPRYKSMQGRFVDRKAGWDTQGLPVELQVEKKLGLKNKKEIEAFGIAKFNAECQKDVWTFMQDWEKLTKRIGFWLDLNHPYITYTNEYIESVWAVIKAASEQTDGLGQPLLYQGYKVVPYCTRCGTALSSHEVAQGYKLVNENSVFIKFKLTEKLQGKAAFVIGWTTTPWTLPGNVALAVGQDIDYAVIDVANDERYVIGTDVWGDVQKRAAMGIDGAKLVSTIKGKELVGLSYQPLFSGAVKSNQNAFKIYSADFVNTSEGTGIVHTAVMYGEDDYNLGVQEKLPTEHTVGEDGRFLSHLGELSGMYVKSHDTENIILDHLKRNDNLMAEMPYSHDYPFCWRCDTALLYYARSSWFIRMSALKDKLVKNGETINWEPKTIKTGRMLEWLENIKDWAISRERYWGTPLPIWICPENHLTVIGSLKELSDFGGKAPDDLHRPEIDSVKFACPTCGQLATRVLEVADVWLDSGSMPFAQWGYPHLPGSQELVKNHFPADYISEAIDQTRGWFYTLLAVSTLLGFEAPYKNVICLGHLLDEHGKKMSKSKGNIVDPMLLLDKYGADAIRLYFYSVNPPGEPKLFAEKDLQTVQRRTLMILWNIYSYFVTYANESKWAKKNTTKPSDNVLDIWIKSRLNQLVLVVTKSLDKYDVLTASREIIDFVDDLSTWYLRRSRNRTNELNSETDKNHFFDTMFDVLVTLSKVIAPFTPFIAEKIHTDLIGESVHLQQWPNSETVDEKIIQSMKTVRQIVSVGLEARMAAGVKVRQKLGKAYVQLKSDVLVDSDFTSLITDELNIDNIEFVTTAVSDKNLIQSGSNAIKLWLDATITLELEKDGMIRELVRSIQDWRKTNALTVSDTINVLWNSSDEIIQSMMSDHQYLDMVQKSTRSTVKHQPNLGDQFIQVDLNGRKIDLQFKK